MISTDGFVSPRGKVCSPREILEMDWLSGSVTDSIATLGKLTPEAAELVRMQGILLDKERML